VLHAVVVNQLHDTIPLFWHGLFEEMDLLAVGNPRFVEEVGKMILPQFQIENTKPETRFI
jgi:hypothetical protein